MSQTTQDWTDAPHAARPEGARAGAGRTYGAGRVRAAGAYDGGDASIGALISSLLSDTSRLVRDEVRLAKAEVGEKVDQARGGAVMLGLGVGTLLLGAIYLIQSLIYLLAEVMVPWLAALIVGGVIAGIGYVLLKKGLSDLKAKNLAPTRTQENLSRDAHMVKESV